MAKQKAIFTGIRYTGVSTLVSALSGMLQVAVLARWLTPAEFAPAAYSSVLVNLVLQLQSGGINAGIVQQPDFSQDRLTALWRLNMILGALLFVLLAVGAKILVHNDLIIGVITVHSLVILFQAFGVQYKALLQKQLAFKTLAIAELGGAITAFLAAVIVAFRGGGAYAVVAGYLGRYVFESIFCCWKGMQYFVPGRRTDWKGLKPLFSFSAFHLAERISMHLVSQLDVLMIGYCLGNTSLGIYDAFKRLVGRPVSMAAVIFDRIAFPLMAKVKDRKRILSSIYFSGLEMLAMLLQPLYIVLALAAGGLVPLIYGGLWSGYTHYFQWLCVVSLFQMLLNPIDSFLLALGRIKYWLAAHLTFTPVLVLALWWGANRGLEGMLLGMVIAHTMLAIGAYAGLGAKLLFLNHRSLLLFFALPLVGIGFAGRVSSDFSIIIGILSGIGYFFLMAKLFPNAWIGLRKIIVSKI